MLARSPARASRTAKVRYPQKTQFPPMVHCAFVRSRLKSALPTGGSYMAVGLTWDDAQSVVNALFRRWDMEVDDMASDAIFRGRLGYDNAIMAIGYDGWIHGVPAVLEPFALH